MLAKKTKIAESADYFGTFLSNLNRPLREETLAARDNSGETKVLQALAMIDGASSVRSLLADTAISPSAMMMILQNLDRAKIVKVYDTADEQMVELTELGRKISPN